MKGWGPNSSVCPSKPRESNFFWRDIPGFCQDIPEAHEKFEKKMFGFNSRPHNYGCEFLLVSLGEGLGSGARWVVGGGFALENKGKGEGESRACNGACLGLGFFS